MELRLNFTALLRGLLEAKAQSFGDGTRKDGQLVAQF